MFVGINYPWIDYGWDFGDPPAAWVASKDISAWREGKRKGIEEDFKTFASQGIFAVRWFLLADGLNYGTGDFAPRKTGNQWMFEPLPADHSFYSGLQDDFEFVLRVCLQYGLKLFPSLIDFSWCHQGVPMRGNPEIVKGGRYGVVRDAPKRQAFFDRILDPLLMSSMQYRDSLYAWELINEPEWVIRGSWKTNKNRNVTREEMKAFIMEGTRRINAIRLDDGSPAFRSSIGFAHRNSIDKWNAHELGITLHQFHYYAQKNRALPSEAHSTGRPCVVGEFATAVGRDWPDLKEQNREQTVTNRLACIEQKGYPACFLWSAKSIDAATRWNEETHRAVFACSSLNRRAGIRA